MLFRSKTATAASWLYGLGIAKKAAAISLGENPEISMCSIQYIVTDKSSRGKSLLLLAHQAPAGPLTYFLRVPVCIDKADCRLRQFIRAPQNIYHCKGVWRVSAFATLNRKAANECAHKYKLRYRKAVQGGYHYVYIARSGRNPASGLGPG